MHPEQLPVGHVLIAGIELLFDIVVAVVPQYPRSIEQLGFALMNQTAIEIPFH